MGDDNDATKRARKTLLGIGIGAAIAAVFPPAGVALGAASILSSARTSARSGDPDDALGMVTGVDDLPTSDGSDD